MVPCTQRAIRQTTVRQFAALLMLSAIALRLATLLPSVPVLHWHGPIAMIHAGGGIPHHHVHVTKGEWTHDDSEDQEERPSEENEKPNGGAYYSPASNPLSSIGAPVCFPNAQPPSGGLPIEEQVCEPREAVSPGPTRGPPSDFSRRSPGTTRLELLLI